MAVTLNTNDITMGSGAVIQNPSGSAPSYVCRAWVNFNGTGTVAIRASGNVSSIADNGTGLYTVNFSTAMPDVNYCITTCAVSAGTGDMTGFGMTTGTTPSVGSVQLYCKSWGISSTDSFYCCPAFFR
jgi:hypothetical protein